MKQQWWKESVVYQIYPRSFNDSNGDGIGDLRGIIQKLDYLKELGIDVVWLSPVYKSPNDDMGYDISDYQEIMDEFGTLHDWEELLAGMHERGIKLMMDLVVNHTSDEHPWFIEAHKTKDNSHRDYYIWRPGKEGREPNNWLSFFGGSAWEYDQVTGEYYLHLFSKKQPDLNWENPAVRSEVFALMRWWLDKGVDGFRMDVINLISKVPGLPDAQVRSPDRYQWGGQYFVHGPRLLEFLQEMKREALEPYDTITVGEAAAVTTEQAVELTDEENGPLNMVFQFEHMSLDRDLDDRTARAVKRWKLLDLKQVMTRWEKALEGRGWNSLYLSNHDQPRQVSRFGDDGRYRVESAKLLGTFLHLLQGTPYIYQGEELGMTNVAFDSVEEYRDIAARNRYRELVEERGMQPGEALQLVNVGSRDNARTPMQWDDSDNAGFTSGTPWIKVNPNYREINAKQAVADPQSIFHYYQQLIQLRKANPVMVEGRYDLILPEDEEIYAFTRTLDDDRLLVILNFTTGTPVFRLSEEITVNSPELLISNYSVDAAEDLRQLTLKPFEARVYRLH
ncbi:MAG: alpha-glucosidase [Herpetosiphonaceae bacterium]|nr:alpha-glucosidase [Herpetosiphonaceae bacterium]